MTFTLVSELSDVVFQQPPEFSGVRTLSTLALASNKQAYGSSVAPFDPSNALPVNGKNGDDDDDGGSSDEPESRFQTSLEPEKPESREPTPLKPKEPESRVPTPLEPNAAALRAATMPQEKVFKYLMTGSTELGGRLKEVAAVWRW